MSALNHVERILGSDICRNRCDQRTCNEYTRTMHSLFLRLSRNYSNNSQIGWLCSTNQSSHQCLAPNRSRRACRDGPRTPIPVFVPDQKFLSPRFKFTTPLPLRQRHGREFILAQTQPNSDGPTGTHGFCQRSFFDSGCRGHCFEIRSSRPLRQPESHL